MDPIIRKRERKFKCVFMMEEIRDIKYCQLLHKIFFINFLSLLMFDNKCSFDAQENGNVPIASMRFKVHLPMPQFAIAGATEDQESLQSITI